jgi:hypothetical protein
MEQETFVANGRPSNILGVKMFRLACGGKAGR